MRGMVESVRAAVEAGKVSVHPERQLHADVGLRVELVHLLESYAAAWLRIGLETVLGQELRLGDRRDRIAAILAHLLVSPDILQRHAHAGVRSVISDSGSPGRIALSVLKGSVLRSARGGQALPPQLSQPRHLPGRGQEAGPHDARPLSLPSRCIRQGWSSAQFFLGKPLPFVRRWQSTKDLLVAVAKQALTSAAEMEKVLKRAAFCPAVLQLPIHEYSFTVTNFVPDLADGIRLL